MSVVMAACLPRCDWLVVHTLWLRFPPMLECTWILINAWWRWWREERRGTNFARWVLRTLWYLGSLFAMRYNPERKGLQKRSGSQKVRQDALVQSPLRAPLPSCIACAWHVSKGLNSRGHSEMLTFLACRILWTILITGRREPGSYHLIYEYITWRALYIKCIL